MDSTTSGQLPTSKKTSPKPVGHRVQKLPDTVINQIAAGEVVERPASVIKELVENSLDAGSTSIQVVLSDGGIKEILVTDDGSGMSAADLELCAERHATSKIRQAEDLEQIDSFGFRGEALSSISSVSRFEIRSRTEDDTEGSRIQIAFGKTEPIEPCALPKGTQVRVRDLFKQVPARQKYLRSVSTELSHCAKVLKEVALGNPHVRFSLRHQQKTLQSFVPGERASRVKEVLKHKWEPLVVQTNTEEMALEAYLSPPEWRQERGELLLYINQRPVRHRALFANIRNLYADALGPHHHPSGVIYLDLRKDWVDVNVHPQKWEVRVWQQERLIPWVRSALRKAISAHQGMKELGQKTEAPDQSPENSQENAIAEPTAPPYFEEQSSRPLPPIDFAPKKHLQTGNRIPPPSLKNFRWIQPTQQRTL